jgi:ribosomal protein S18 acetylase RimI-like enzyme
MSVRVRLATAADAVTARPPRLARRGAVLAVDAAHRRGDPRLDRRQGIGTLLLRQVQAAGPDGLTFVVFARNTAARAFYERAGCRVIAASDGGANEEGEPDVAYEWTP